MDLQAIARTACNRVTGYLASEENLKTVVAGSAAGILSYGCVTILTKASFGLLAAASWTIVGAVCAIAAKHIYEAATRADEEERASPVTGRVSTSPTTAGTPPTILGTPTVDEREDSPIPLRVPTPAHTSPAPTAPETTIRPIQPSPSRTPVDEPLIFNPTSRRGTPIDGAVVTPPTPNTPTTESQYIAVIKEGIDLWDALIANKVSDDTLEAFNEELESLYSQEGQPLYSITNRIIDGCTFQTIYDVSKWTHMVVDFAAGKITGEKTALKCWNYCHKNHEAFGEFILEEKLKNITERNQNYPQKFITREIRGAPLVKVAITRADKPKFLERIKFFTGHIVDLIK